MTDLALFSQATADDLLSPTAPPEVRALAALLNRCGPATREAYGRDVLGFVAWCEGKGLFPLAATKIHIEAWKREMESAKAAPASVRRRLAAVQQYFLEAQELDPNVRVPTLRVKRPNVEEDQKLGIDRDQARQLLIVATDSGLRDEVLVRLLLLNGLRASEACEVTAGAAGEIQGHRVIRYIGKGGKRLVVSLALETASAIDALAATAGANRPKSAPLLRGPNGLKLNRWEAARIVQRLGRLAGIKGKLNPHELRHAFVTLSLMAGVSLQNVQESAGHADPKTTMGYDRARNKLENHATYRLAEFLKEN